jgi:hypothetical protein
LQLWLWLCPNLRLRLWLWLCPHLWLWLRGRCRRLPHLRLRPILRLGRWRFLQSALLRLAWLRLARWRLGLAAALPESTRLRCLSRRNRRTRQRRRHHVTRCDRLCRRRDRRTPLVLGVKLLPVLRRLLLQLGLLRHWRVPLLAHHRNLRRSRSHL